MDLPELIKQVKPSVALIEVMEKGRRISNGSGYIVDASGIIATNYHVIEGAKNIQVSFPGDKTKGSVKFKAEGFIAHYAKKDMALIKINPKDAKLRALPLAKEVPTQGVKVAAFGAPLGYSDTVTNGIISAVRSGKELTQMMTRGGRDGYGKDGLGYEVNTTWLQTSAPISPGNSGGPLVNYKGEVVGMNSFVSTIGQNLNFSLSITHIIKFIADSDNNVHPFSDLPKPRDRGHGGGPSGDPKKTLKVWKEFNKARIKLNEAIDSCEKRLRRLPKINPRNPMQGANIRNRKISDSFQRLGEAYKEYSSDVSSIDNKNCDPEVIGLILHDTVIAKKISALCKDVCNSASSGGGTVNWEAGVGMAKDAFDEADAKREVTRVTMGLKYGLTFPTVSDTEDEEEKLAKEGKSKPGKTASDNPERSKMRVWTDSSGRFKINAKCIGIENGKVKLEKADGAVLEVPLDKLSEEDKRFLASTG